MRRDGSLLILDTNILIRLVRNDVVGRKVADDFDLTGRRHRPLISVVTAGEIHAFSLKLNWKDRKRRLLTDLLGHLVLVDLHRGQIVERYAEIDQSSARLVKPARTIGQNDKWIAATAAETRATLLTTDHDVEHLHGHFLEVLTRDARTGERL